VTMFVAARWQVLSTCVRMKFASAKMKLTEARILHGKGATEAVNSGVSVVL
jgi:hypothetical protein